MSARCPKCGGPAVMERGTVEPGVMGDLAVCVRCDELVEDCTCTSTCDICGRHFAPTVGAALCEKCERTAKAHARVIQNAKDEESGR